MPSSTSCSSSTVSGALVTVIEYARQWGRNGELTNGKNMIIIGAGANHWCVGHQVRAPLALGESDHVADRMATEHHRHQAVNARSQSRVGRCAVTERVHEETEPALDVVFRKLQGAEDLFLNIRVVNTNRAAGAFVAIQD